MRGKLFYLACIFSATIIHFSFAPHRESITFRHASWYEIGKKARAEKKMIFVIIKADWCRACKKMQRETANAEVGSFYNEHFVNTTFDADNLMQYYRASNWGITTVPAMVFLDEKRNVIYTVKGYRNAAGMLEEANIAMQKRNYKWERKKNNPPIITHTATTKN